MSLDALWGWWIANRDHVVALATLIGGPIALVLLFVRTRAADRTARAALDQAKVAAAQAKTAVERHYEQTNADRERRITESFAKAVEQLGSDKLETRLGGIYTLERISREEETEHEFYWAIMETLTAFVRERAPWPPLPMNPFACLLGNIVGKASGEPIRAERDTESPIRPAADIQAVLTVLGRRKEEQRRQEKAAGRRLDLRATDLRGVNLQQAHLEYAIFEKAHFAADADLTEVHLQDARLWGAHFEATNLGGAHLEGAYLAGAHLEGARLAGAHLDGADLVPAHLEGAYLVKAHWNGARLSGARLHGAILTAAVGLTQKQLNSAYGDVHTILPEEEGLTRPAHWSKPAPGDPDNAG